jgi:tetratricopeptide (TPR) repeat protein
VATDLQPHLIVVTTGESFVIYLLGNVAGAAPEAEHVTLLAEALLRTARPREAERWLRRAMPDVERSGDRIARRRAVNLWGNALFELGQLEAAELAFRRASGFAARHGNPVLEGETLRARAQLAAACGAVDDARQHANAALALFASAGARTDHDELAGWCTRLDRSIPTRGDSS